MSKIIDLGDILEPDSGSSLADAREEEPFELDGADPAGWLEAEKVEESQRNGRLPKRPRTAKSLKAEAVAMLARREHSRLELQQKLIRKFPDRREEAQSVLSDLEERGYLSNSRFAERFVRAKASRYGAGRLQIELRRRGISGAEIQQALDAVEEPELERAWNVWERKFSGPPEDERERGRQIRFLASRGFSYSVIRQVLERARRQGDDE